MKITIIYRICDTVEVCSSRKRCFNVSKKKLISKCFDKIVTNAKRFNDIGGKLDFICVYDHCSDETVHMVGSAFPQAVFIKPAIPGNAGSFCQCVSEALKIPDNEIVYFLEDDYLLLHDRVFELIWFNMNKLSEYEGRHAAIMPDDYPDRYSENTYTGTLRVTQTGHFIKINSTTCTFVAYSDDIKRHEDDLMRFINWPILGEAESINKMWADTPLYNPVPAWTLHSQTRAVMPIYIDFNNIDNYFKS